MKDQINTIREFVESQRHVGRTKALTALAQIEAAVGEPVARYNWHTAKLEWLVPYKAEFNMKPLYFAAPVAQQYEAGDMASAAAQGFRDGAASVAQQPQYPLPDDLYSDSKDWAAGTYAERVEWLHTMYESQRALVAEYERQFDQQPQAEPFGYVSQHTNGSWEFSPTAAGVYPDTAKSITAVYTKQPQAEPDWINGVPHWSPALIAKVKQMAAELGEPEQPQAEPTCNPHPKAPHGFNRNASHTEDRYVCDCESWDAWDAGYSAGWRAGFDAPQQAEAVPPDYVLVPVEPDETWAYQVIRRHQPNLDVGCKAWLECLEELLYWHAAIAQQKGQP